MLDSLQEKKSLGRRAKNKLSGMFRRDRLPVQASHSTSDLPQASTSRTSQSPPALSTTANHPLNTLSTATSQTPAAQVPPLTTPTTSDDDPYLVLSGSMTPSPSPPTRIQKAKEVASTAYGGLTQVVQALYDCSDMFLPLKTIAGVFLAIDKVVGTVTGNKTQLEELEAKLGAILSIVQKYKKYSEIHFLKHRIETFCQAIALQMEAVLNLRGHSLWARTAEGTKDADDIAKAFRTMGILCDIFQIDTQLNTNVIVEDILQRLKSGTVNKLNHGSTSYKTRHSSYGDPCGCMEGTRIKILADLEAWAFNDNGSKVYWMVGMAGTGKSTISQTFCKILDGKNMLAASFFCSRASEKTNNVRFIVPTIAYELAKSSPIIKSEIVMAIDDDEKLAEENYLNLEDQFKKLVYQPIRSSTGLIVKMYKVVVIDAVDECADIQLASSLIRLILGFVASIPLKIFIASRDETPIRKALESRPDIPNAFYLHDVEKDVVQRDIHRYLEISLAKIEQDNGGHTSGQWPSHFELSALLDRSGTLFIYAATAIRYIADGNELYKYRLSEMANRGPESGSGFQTDIDGLYGHVLGKACERKPPQEVSIMRELVSIIVFLRNPLPADAVESILQIDAGLLSAYLSPLTSIIHFPVNKELAVAPFHASFPDFLTDSARCSPERCPRFKALAASDGHTELALRCLEHMNRFLKYNICGVPEESTVCRMGTINLLENIGKIPEALKYSSLHWASHLAEVQVLNTNLIIALHNFVHKHLLHWIECVSTLGELQAGLESLVSAAATLQHLKTATADIRWDGIQSLVKDACRCLQMNFEGIQNNCFEIYWSVLVWIPTESPIRKVYAEHVCRVPKLILGSSNWWGSTELVIQNNSVVKSVALSPDGNRVVSGSDDNTVRIWNATTGEVQAELKGHRDWMKSVAFSQDGSRVASGSKDKTVRIWNTMTGEVQAELKGHRNRVMSVAFSQDGSRVVSGSYDKTVRIWNTTTGDVLAELNGHTDWVISVTFSQDRSRVASGSDDKTVRIWNATTGEVQAELKGHMRSVTSVMFSQDGSRVVSGSEDKTIRIWNTTTGEVLAELTGHTDWVTSLACSQDGNRVVSGSYDNTVRIWNTTTGEVQAELKGHTNWVTSVMFSQDGSRVVSGSHDKTIRIWNIAKDEVQPEPNGHTNQVRSVSFSQDGSRVVSGSGDKTVRIWDATTGEVLAELKGHTHSVRSVVFSQDSSRVVSGSEDKTVRIWDTMSYEVLAELKGHTDLVASVAFSHDGSRVASGSDDNTVRIWDTTTGEAQAELKGHTNWVRSVAFSLDGSRVVSGSFDKTVRIWDTTTGEMQAELKGHTHWMRSVAFSQDGSRVISGSFNSPVRIWDVVTGNSQLMTTPSITLPDSTEVHRAGPGKFHIIYPAQRLTHFIHPTLSLSDDRQWILGALHNCWIPPHRRSFGSFSFSGTRICLGYGSGRLVILDMNVTPLVL